MNRIFKVVWNQALGTWMAVSELGNKNRKTKSSRTQKATLLAGALGVALAGAQAEEVTSEEIIDNGKLLEIRNLHKEDGGSSGVVYNKKITGEKSLEISAPNVGFKANKLTDRYKGEDDRYGRSVQLEYTDEPNDFEGDITVNHGVSLHVGRKSTDHNVLGDGNNLSINGFTDVTIWGNEIINTLDFSAGDSEKITKHENDQGNFFDKEPKEGGGYHDARSYYELGGGTLHLSALSGLTVKGETNFTGGDSFRVGISAYEAKADFKKKATFNSGQVSLQDKSDFTFQDVEVNNTDFTVYSSEIKFEKETIFGDVGRIFLYDSKGSSAERLRLEGSGSSFSATGESEFNARDGILVGSKDVGHASFEVNTGSIVNVENDIEVNKSSLSVLDGLGFSSESHYADEKDGKWYNNQGVEVDNRFDTQNQSVKLTSPDTKQGSKLVVSGDINFNGDANQFNVAGSSVEVAGDIVATQGLKSLVMGSDLTSKNVKLGSKANMVMGASALKTTDFEVGEGSNVFVGGNTIDVTGNIVLNNQSRISDMSYIDGSNAGDRIQYIDIYAHHGLTYDEFKKVLAGEKSDSENDITGKPLRYDIEKPASLHVGGNAILKEGATYDAKGDVTIGRKLDLAFDDNKFLVHAGNASVGAGSEIKGLIGIDKGKTFSFNGGKTTFHKDQDQLFGTLAVGSGATLDISGRTIVDGKGTGILDVKKGGTLIAGGKATTVSHLHNNGSVYIGNAIDYWPNPHGLLTVKGNYIGGEGSTLYFGKVTASGDEVTPLTTGGHKNLMIVEGNASGKSNIDIGEVTSADKITKKGVLLVHVKGNSTLTLTPSQPLTSGGVEYGFVGRKGVDTMDQGQNSWYIVNDYVDVSSNPGGEPVGDGGENPTEPEKPAEPVDKSGQYSPEVGAYLANHVLGNIMFELKYHDRQYLPEYEGVWMHAKASFGKYRTDLGSALESKVDYYTIHLGKDLLDKQEYNAGVMIAYGYSDGNTKNHARGFKADHSSHGFALGLYGTYNFDEHSYLDAWAQYVFMRNSIDYKNQNEKYNSRGIIASIEAGHAFDLNETLKLQPQAQITYMGVKADDYADRDNTKVTTNRGNVQLRLGARLFNERAWFDGQVTPYAEFNYIHNTKPFEVRLEGNRFGRDITNASVAGNKNLYQLELGAKTELENNWTISGGVSFTKGKDKYRDTRIKLDLRYEF